MPNNFFIWHFLRIFVYKKSVINLLKLNTMYTENFEIESRLIESGVTFDVVENFEPSEDSIVVGVVENDLPF